VKEEAMTIYYSCDSHVVEPPEVFAGLTDRFGERAPQIVDEFRGRKGTFLYWKERDFGFPVGRFGIAGHRLDDPATQERMLRGWDGMNPGVRDPVARLKEQAQDGIVGEVMYPSINMLTFSCPDREVVQAVFQRHNDWIADYCATAPDRLIGVACMPLPDVDAALVELDRMVKKGIRGIAIPCTAPPDKLYSDPAYEPFWSAAEEAGLPVTMHIFCGATWGMNAPAHWNEIVSYTLSHAAIAETLVTLITSGVAHRHPGLRFVLAEWETGWLGHVLQRMDHATYRARSFASPELDMEPSEYFRRQFYATFEDDEIGVRTREFIGVDNLLWGNDYPHHDSIWPRSMEILRRIFKGVPQTEVDAMVWGNVQKLYGIDEARLQKALAAA
jgi:predicted TIM-barrel fold metal-dependent hydrolase